jgi:branched-chain amino acid transport system substrate-binding protein
MRIVFQGLYPAKATDLSSLITKVKAAKPEVLVGGSYQTDAVLITRQAKELDLNVKMLSFSVGAAMPEFGEGLGKDADFVFGPSMWEPSLNTKGNIEFLNMYKKKWNREPDYHAATGFAGGQILEAAVGKAKSLDREKIREALSTIEVDTVLPGKYKVDDTGAQTAHVPVVIQWQGTEKPVIGPDAMATGKPKLPMPEWKSRS